jgi:hypothetical protein
VKMLLLPLPLLLLHANKYGCIDHVVQYRRSAHKRRLISRNARNR